MAWPQGPREHPNCRKATGGQGYPGEQGSLYVCWHFHWWDPKTRDPKLMGGNIGPPPTKAGRGETGKIIGPRWAASETGTRLVTRRSTCDPSLGRRHSSSRALLAEERVSASVRVQTSQTHGRRPARRPRQGGTAPAKPTRRPTRPKPNGAAAAVPPRLRPTNKTRTGNPFTEPKPSGDDRFAIEPERRGARRGHDGDEHLVQVRGRHRRGGGGRVEGRGMGFCGGQNELLCCW